MYCVAEDKIFACACVPIPLCLHVYEWRYMKLNIKSSMNQPLTPFKWESQHTSGTSNQRNREVLYKESLVNPGSSFQTVSFCNGNFEWPFFVHASY